MKQLAILLAFAVLAGCGSEGEDEPPFPNSPSPTSTPSGSFAASVTAQPSPTPPAVPERSLPTSGPSSEGCVNGWVTPPEGSARATFPIRMIGRSVRLPGEPVVVDLRYFTGPESPPSDKGYLATVERWYVKLYSKRDLAFQGRFLVESREFGSGLVAVAPYDTSGFRSPDWSGFQWDEADPDLKAYPGLPGSWPGNRYDFVEGGAGLGIPGLPPDVRGCMETT